MTVLAARFRACWHILRGRRVMYGVSATGGDWHDQAWRTDLIMVDCRFLPEFTINGTPALELQDRRGDVRVRSAPGRNGDWPGEWPKRGGKDDR